MYNNYKVILVSLQNLIEVNEIKERLIEIFFLSLLNLKFECNFVKTQITNYFLIENSYNC